MAGESPCVKFCSPGLTVPALFCCAIAKCIDPELSHRPQQWHRQNNVHNDIADTVSRAFAALDRGKPENSIMTFWHSQASWCCCALITEAARLTDCKSCFREFQSDVVSLNNCTFMLHIWFSQKEISRLNRLCVKRAVHVKWKQSLVLFQIFIFPWDAKETFWNMSKLLLSIGLQQKVALCK